MAKKTDAEPKTELDTDGFEHWPLFRTIVYVHAQEQEDGNYLLVGAFGDSWVAEREDFHRRYKPVTPNKS